MMIATTALLLTLLSQPALQAEQAAGARDVPEQRQATTAAATEASNEPSAATLHHGTAPKHAGPRDRRQRIEVRVGGWADGEFGGFGETWSEDSTAHGAFGLEYLTFIRNDIGIGVALTSVASANSWDTPVGDHAARAVTGIPVVARWYPVRRLTPFRSMEPYVTVGAGPVFAADTRTAFDEGRWHHDGFSTTRVGMAFGGRVGGGMDFRLGRTFTLGLAGAWNWDTGFDDDLWRGPRPGGGEFTVSFGWNFGKYGR